MATSIYVPLSVPEYHRITLNTTTNEGHRRIHEVDDMQILMMDTITEGVTRNLANLTGRRIKQKQKQAHSGQTIKCVRNERGAIKKVSN